MKVVPLSKNDRKIWRCTHTPEAHYRYHEVEVKFWSHFASGSCLSGQQSCGIIENDCYEKTKECDGHWDCPINGGDEFNCRKSFHKIFILV